LFLEATFVVPVNLVFIVLSASKCDRCSCRHFGPSTEGQYKLWTPHITAVPQINTPKTSSTLWHESTLRHRTRHRALLPEPVSLSKISPQRPQTYSNVNWASGHTQLYSTENYGHRCM